MNTIPATEQTSTAPTAPTASMQRTRVVPIKIRNQLCYPKFTCIHLNFPGLDQLKRNLARYRQKDVLIHLFDNANNFELLDEELHSKLFGDKQDGIRITWEYMNIMIQYLGGAEFLITCPKDNDTFQKLTDFCERNGSLPLSAEKSSLVFSEK